MARAGFIRETGDGSTRYFAPVRPWAQLLELGGPPASADGSAGAPAWRYWSGVFAFLAQADRWAQGADDMSNYLLSSRARDLYKKYQPAFENNRIETPHPEAHRGAAYLEGFETTIRTLSHWISDHL